MDDDVFFDVKQLFTRAQISPGMTVADFGIGQMGHATRAVARHVGKDGMVLAVDLVPSVLASVRNQAIAEGLTHVRTIWGDFERKGSVQIPSDTVDVVLFMNNVWVTSDLDAALAQARRVLRPQGKMLMVDWLPEIEHPMAPDPSGRLGRIDAERALRKAGFARVDALPENDTHWTLLGFHS